MSVREAKASIKQDIKRRTCEFLSNGLELLRTEIKVMVGV